MRRVAIAIAAAVIVIGTAGYLWAERALIVPGKQVRNFADLQLTARCVTEAQEANLEWPRDLEDAIRQYEALHQVELADWLKDRIDYWGNPIVYESRPDGFILASLGRDGIRDNDDLWLYRSTGDGCADDSPCRNANADTVISDRGYHRCCGK